MYQNNMNESKIINAKDPAAISSSSESETFETWTLVTPPEISDKTKADNIMEESNVQEANECHIEKIKKDESHTDGELSDGISVISDSESAGRASPQPAPRRSSPVKRISSTKRHLNENDSDNPDGGQPIAAQYEPITPPRTPDHVDLSTSENTNTEPILQLPIASEFGVRINLTYVFYLTAFVAVVAFWSRIKTPEWDNETNPLHSKIDLLLHEANELNVAIQFLRNKMEHLSDKIEQQNSINSEKISEEYSRIIRPRDGKNSKCSDYLFRAPSSGSDSENAKEKLKEYVRHDQKRNNDRAARKYDNLTPNIKQNRAQETSEDHQNQQSNEYEMRKNNKRKFEKNANDDRKYDESKPERTQRRYTMKEEENEDWHEKMMRHREEIRKQRHDLYAKQDGADDSNWYLERGTGRRDARKPEKKDKRT